jgi:beta propeller repeat protein
MKKVVILLIVIVFLFQAMPSYALSHVVTNITVKQITTSSNQENKPLIYKDTVVFEKHTSNPSGVDIYSYNLKTQTEAILVNREKNQFPAAINEDYLLYNEYTEDPITSYDVRILNLKTMQDKILIGGAGDQLAQDMEHNIIAYIEGSGCGELHIYNLKTKKNIPIASNAYGARISGQHVVWYECQGGGYYGIKGYDLNRMKPFNISSVNNGYQETPDIYKDDVVWRDSQNGKNTIYLKNLIKGKEKIIATTSTELFTYPVISQNYIVWVRDRGIGAHDLMVYNRMSGETLNVCANGGQQSSPTIPEIYGDQAVWMSWHTGNGDIYLASFNNSYPKK